METSVEKTDAMAGLRHNCLEFSRRLRTVKKLSAQVNIVRNLSKGVLQRADEANTTGDLELLELLAKDPEWPIREAVAYNKHAPKSILEWLLKDASPFVKYAAERRLREICSQ
jgi:hypothetical protein